MQNTNKLNSLTVFLRILRSISNRFMKHIKLILATVVVLLISLKANATLVYNMTGLTSSDTLTIQICTNEDILIVAPNGYMNPRWYGDPPPSGLINPSANYGGVTVAVLNPMSGGGTNDSLRISGSPILARSLFLVIDSSGVDITIPIGVQYEDMNLGGAASADAGMDRFSCGGDSVKLFSAVSTSLNIKWLPGEILQDTITVGTSGIYELHACRSGLILFGGAYACCARDCVEVVINQSPIVTSNSDTLLCPGSSLQISSSVTNTDPSYNFVWKGDTGDLNVINSINPIANITTAGIRTYTIVVTDTTAAACSDSATFQVEMTPTLDANLAFSDSAICASDSINLLSNTSGGTPNYQLAWYELNPKTQISSIANPKIQTFTFAQFLLEITDSLGCTAVSDTVTVAPTDLALVNNTGNDTVGICQGQTTTLCISGTGGNPPYSYNWTPTDSLSSLTDSCTISSATSSVSYNARLSDSKGCFLDQAFFLEVVSLPFAFLPNMPDDSTICLNDTIQLIATASGGTGTGYTFAWTKTFSGIDELISGSSDTAYFVKTDGTIPNDVRVTVTDNFNCKSGPESMSLSGVEKPSGNPELTHEGNLIFSNKSVNGLDPNGTILNFKSNANKYDTLQWILSDAGIVSYHEDLDTLMEDSGSYVMTLRLIAEQNACVIDYPLPFQVVDRNSAYVFNVITPNGDDKNQALFIDRLDFFGENELVIFNRWGNELYRTMNYDNTNGWSGDGLPDGTYFYHLTVEGDPLSPHKGSFMIIR